MQKFVNKFLRFLAKLISTVWEIQYLSTRKDFSLTTDKYLNEVGTQFAIYANQIDSSDLNTHLATLFILNTHCTTKLDGMLTISKGYVKYVSRSALL